MKKLNILEFKLNSYLGHCFATIKSLADANLINPIARLTICCPSGQSARLISQKLPSCAIKTFPKCLTYIRPLEYFVRQRVIKKCLKNTDNLFISTGLKRDLFTLAKYHKLISKNQNISICFHSNQFNKLKWQNKIKNLTNKINKIKIAVTTEALKDEFKKIGLTNLYVVPAPIPQHQNVNTQLSNFKHLLYAGEARVTKGFIHVARLVQFLNGTNNPIPMTIQVTSPDQKKEDKLQPYLNTLKTSCPDFVTLLKTAPSTEAFQANFEGAISLLLYDTVGYKNTMSGLFVDSIYAGAPVICTDGTLIADQTREYSCGEIVKDPSNPKEILAVINKIKNNYTEYFKNTLKTKKILENKHDPLNTLKFACGLN